MVWGKATSPISFFYHISLGDKIMALRQTARATVEIPVTCPRCNHKMTARAERRFLNLDLAIEFKNYLNLYGINSRVRFNNLKITRKKK